MIPAEQYGLPGVISCMMTVAKGAGFIAAAAGIALWLSLSADYTYQELGFLMNFFWPAVLSLLLLLGYLCLCSLSENRRLRSLATMLFCSYLIYAGFTFHVPQRDWPLTFW